MRVLMIEHFSPGNAYATDLCRYLSNHIKLTILCKDVVNEKIKGANLIPALYSGGGINKLKSLADYITGILTIRAELISEKYEIVHVQTFKAARIEIGLYKKYKSHNKLVHTVHNVLPHEERKKDRELYGGFYRCCDALIVHNEASKFLLVSYFGIDESKIFVIPHGAYCVGSIPPVKKKDTVTHFLMFGTIREYKGVDVLLKAIAEIPQSKRKHMDFIIAGQQYSNQDRTDYEEMIAELGISENVKMRRERIPDSEIRTLFAWADACVFPYKEIYGSGALLMAYAYRKPVIVSNVPAFVEETDQGKTGLLFESGNEKALAEKLMDYDGFSDETRNAMVSSIAELVASKYNWEISAEKTKRVYDSLDLGKNQ